MCNENANQKVEDRALTIEYIFLIYVHGRTYRPQINGLCLTKRSEIRPWEALRAENCRIALRSYIGPLSIALFGEALNAKRDCLSRDCIYRVICQRSSYIFCILKENGNSTRFHAKKEKFWYSNIRFMIPKRFSSISDFNEYSHGNISDIATRAGLNIIEHLDAVTRTR